MSTYKMLERLGLDSPSMSLDQARAMGRKEEFEFIRKKYPDVPVTFVLKTDLVRRGVAFTRKALQRLQDPYFEHAPHVLFDYHHIDNVETYEIPISGYFRDGMITGTILGAPENDPWVIDIVDDSFWIMEDGSPFEEIFFHKMPRYYGKRTRSGAMMQSVAMQTGGDCMLICPSGHCEYWNTDEQCRFCDIDYNTRHQMKMGREFKARVSPEDVYDTVYEALKEKGKWRRIFLTGGTNSRDGHEADVEYYCDHISAAQNASKDLTGERINGLQAIIALREKEQYVQLKEAGLDAIGLYIEVWDKEIYKHLCPGKYKDVGEREVWMEAQAKAVEVFGRGNVNCAFVSGAELALPPPRGFDNIDEAVENNLEGFEILIKMGVVPNSTNLFIEPGSDLYKMGAPIPPLEFYIKLDKGRYLLQKELGNGIVCCYTYRQQPWSAYPMYERLL